MNRLLIVIFIMSMACTASGTDYYISNTGTATWPDCSNISTPCSVTEGTANVTAGHTLVFRAGTYTVTGGGIRPTNSGTLGNVITLESYPEETVIFNGDSSRNVVISTQDRNYVTFDGFTLSTDMAIAGPQAALRGTGCTIKNCIFEGQTSSISTNQPAIYIDSSGCTNCVISGNTISDYQSTSGSDNVCAIMTYDTLNVIIENNTITNCYNGIYIKENNDGVIVRKNFIYNITTLEGILIHAKGSSSIYAKNIDIYQNVFSNINHVSISMDTDGGGLFDNINIYNNTIYDASLGVDQPNVDTTNISFWNNIFSDIPNNVVKKVNLIYSNYQIFYNTPQVCEFDCGGASDLNDWQIESGFDANSNEGDPNFINADGANPEDYKRSSYPTVGRGGEYETVMGAYIDGTECIGAGCVLEATQSMQITGSVIIQ